jgi:hypothetical protein
MSDHFWPALYPGLIVGLLYGLSLRGLPNAIVGAVGGLVGSALAYWGIPEVGIHEGLLSVAGMVVLAFAAAFCATQGYERIARTSAKK